MIRVWKGRLFRVWAMSEEENAALAITFRIELYDVSPVLIVGGRVQFSP